MEKSEEIYAKRQKNLFFISSGILVLNILLVLGLYGIASMEIILDDPIGFFAYYVIAMILLAITGIAIGVTALLYAYKSKNSKYDLLTIIIIVVHLLFIFWIFYIIRISLLGFPPYGA